MKTTTTTTSIKQHTNSSFTKLYYFINNMMWLDLPIYFTLFVQSPVTSIFPLFIITTNSTL